VNRDSKTAFKKRFLTPATQICERRLYYISSIPTIHLGKKIRRVNLHNIISEKSVKAGPNEAVQKELFEQIKVRRVPFRRGAARSSPQAVTAAAPARSFAFPLGSDG
jgi:hypothetical protein